jgi:hypothetical protein
MQIPTHMQKLSFILVLFLVQHMLIAQTRVKIVDSATAEAIPYANVNIAESQNLVSNAEGYFNIPDSFESGASVIVSYLGYQPVRMTVGALKKNPQVKMTMAEYEIEEVKAQRPNPNTVMSEVRKALKENYKPLTGTKDRIFYRRMDAFTPKEFDFEITKSTGFSKKALASVNSEIAQLITNTIKRAPKDFTDVMADQYRGKGPMKLDVIKGVKFKDERYTTSTDELEKIFTDIVLKHLDTTKYYRVKSGMIGSRDTVSLKKEPKKKSKSEKKPDRVAGLKSSLDQFYRESSPLFPDFEFIHDPEIYDYKYDGAVFSPEGELVYVIKFTPARRKALYSGKMYVSATDFGLARIDYKMVSGKKKEGINLKLVLGIKFAENLAKGTLLYKREPGEPYYLQYGSIESGVYFYLHRPVKFIELAKIDRDVVAFDLKVEGDTYSKVELLNLTHEDLSAVGYADAREPQFEYINIKKYDPELWKEHVAIEPVEEMRRLQIVD